MERESASGIVMILLLASMLSLAFSIQPVKLEPTAWTVDDDGPADFHTIQEAINVASPEDTIFVYNGTYYEHVIVNKTVSLIGENRHVTIIDGNKTGIVVHVKASNTTIRYIQLVNLPQEEKFICKVAKDAEQAAELIEAGFEYVTGEYDDGGKLFRKRKLSYLGSSSIPVGSWSSLV